MNQKYISYLRVSKKSQGMTGLGIDAQKLSVKNFLASHEINEQIESYIEVESGKKADRTELKKAIFRCKETGSTLIIAKLDRLSRDIVFIFTLRDELKRAGVDFLALDLPEANTLTLGIMASFAQHERERISERTKAGLYSINENIKKNGFAIAKKTGRKFEKLGNPHLEDHQSKGTEQSAVVRHKKKVTNTGFLQTSELATLLHESGLKNPVIAERLNQSGYRTPNGCFFLSATVSRLIKDRKTML